MKIIHNETQAFYDAIENEDANYLQDNVHNFEDLNFFVRRSAEVGNVECLKILLKACHTFDGDGQHALIRAVHFKYMDCVKEILNHPCINPTYAANGALCSALQNNDRECVALLAPLSNFLMDGIHLVFAYPLKSGYMECLQYMIDELHTPKRFEELTHCVLETAEHGLYDVADLLALHDTTVLQQIFDAHDPTKHQNAAVWLRDRLLKARLDATLDTTVLSKRRM